MSRDRAQAEKLLSELLQQQVLRSLQSTMSHLFRTTVAVHQRNLEVKEETYEQI